MFGTCLYGRGSLRDRFLDHNRSVSRDTAVRFVPASLPDELQSPIGDRMPDARLAGLFRPQRYLDDDTDRDRYPQPTHRQRYGLSP
jgi:hypothetical protein